MIRNISVILFFILMLQGLSAQETEKKKYSEPFWAIGMAHRSALIPFDTEGENFVGSIVPLVFYEGERFNFSGIEGSYMFRETERWRFSAIGRLRFFDAPEEYQNQIQGDEVHWGLQARYKPIGLSYIDVEVLSDWQWHYSANIRFGWQKNLGKFRIQPRADIKIKGRDYNSYYYGLNQVDVKAGIEWSAGIIASWRVWSNFYFFGTAKLTYLDKSVRKLEIIKSDFVPEFFLGFGLSNDRSKPRKDELSISPYIRVAHGWASTSSLNEIIRFQNVPDPYNNQLSSIFYGHPLTDNLFTLPIDFYLTSGLVWHYGSSVQEIAQEIVMGVKFYVTVPWPVRWRIGFAEGWSYVNNVPYVEAQEQINKDSRPSNLLNYLDPSLDINIGDIFGGEKLKRWWLGYSMHHRSGIFGSSQQFGRISGGSNYNSIYLLYEL